MKPGRQAESHESGVSLMIAPHGKEMAPRPIDSPHSFPLSANLECFVADKHDEDLATNHQEIDNDEEDISMNTLEDVEFVVETAIAAKRPLDMSNLLRKTLNELTSLH